MSNVTFDFLNIVSVPADYSWDEGTPLVEYPNSNLITDVVSSIDVNMQPDADYVGYAPFVSFSLSSFAGTPSPSSVAVQRLVDFGDYYNSDSNYVMNPTLSNAVFCHNYIMPGVYTITLTKTEYVINSTSSALFEPYSCMERYCDQGIQWTWNKTDCEYSSDPKITWNSTLSNQTWEKRWIDRPEETCNASWAAVNGIYVETGDQFNSRYPLSWQWYNFLSQSPNKHNTPTTWEQTGFQQSDQLSWSETSGPCYNFNSLEVNWNWNNITCDLSANPFGTILTWDELQCIQPQATSWDDIKRTCGTSTNTITTLSASKNVITHTRALRVIEIPPTAYLDVTDLTPNKTSPLTVRLSPRIIKSGSFPIEKIVWNLGDGSPLLIQRRWDPTQESPFVFSNTYNLDWKDPRNYDIVHTYRKTNESGFSFYPSLTAYASSTGTLDCAAAMVGPLKLESTSEFNLSILQNELTDHGKVIIGEVGNTAAAWRMDN
jgi:hypothetical protein